MLEATTLGITIDRSWRELYDAIWEPQFFPKWASGLSQSSLQREGDRWRAKGPEGTVWIRFTPPNEFGIMDHHVDVGGGREVYIPLRVIENGEGAEVILTLFRQQGMSDEKFREDQDWVKRDLEGLRALMSA
ncbi:polyketide cyclase [Labrys okinawensis]|uniref:polyketide cyclase n=1 Tax=Labrys okinawensis TaxID=346911 RepID=UPI0039BC7B1A